MGASRKLQGEISRMLKKVQEGVDVFNSIWNKFYDTENANQKEKFEGEGDQEAAALLGPDQDLDPILRDQGQKGNMLPSFLPP
ncbi:hypothetical protein ZWY2020_020388 [Hordeum vulgare]|nr:hypothetical protein ZWY2020_020388 [Hordeum vulgare]